MEARRIGYGQSSFSQHISKPRPAPLTIHDSAISPVNAIDLFQESPHGVTAVAGTLKGADNIMLLEVFLQLRDGQVEDLFDCTIDADHVSRCVDVGDRSMIAVIVLFLSDEAVCRRSTTVGAAKQNPSEITSK